MFGIIKAIFFIFITVIVIIVCMQMFAPQYFDFSKIRKCASGTNMRGLCTNKDLQKGEAIGKIYSIESKDKSTDSELGKLINHSKKGNVDLYTLEYKNRIDVYGYLNKDVKSGEELTADFLADDAPKPNIKSSEANDMIKKFFKNLKN